MKKLLYLFAGIGCGIAVAFAFNAEALSTFLTVQGGTGTTTPSGILYGDNGSTNHLNTVTIGSNLTFSGGTLSASGGSGTFPFTPTTFGATVANSTSTLIGFTQGIYALASSTIGAGGQATGLTVSGGATTTGIAYFAGNVGIGTTSPFTTLSVQGNGFFSGTLTASNITATGTLAVTGLSTLTGGANFPNSMSISGTNNLLSGVGSINFAASTGGSGGQNLHSDGSNMYFESSGGTFYFRPSGQNQNNALALVSAGLTYYNSSATAIFNILSNGNVGIGTTTPYAALSVVGNSGVVADHYNATSTTASSTFQGLTATAFADTGLTSGNCVQASSGGLLTTTGSACGSGSGTFSFTPTTNYNATANATTTPIWFQGTPFSLFASSTAVFTNASTTLLTISGQASASGQNCLQIDTKGFITKTGSACGSTAGTLQAETPSGTINGSNTVFTTTNQPALVELNGAYQSAGGVDYTLTGSGPYTITFVAAPTTGSTLVSLYGNAASTAPWPFTTSDTNYNVAVQSTTTPEWFKTPVSGIFSLMASSTAVFTYASTTALSASNLTSGNCVQASTGGLLTTTGSACGAGGGTFSFTPTTNYNTNVNSTSTPLWFTNGLMASTTSYLTYASTTVLSAANLVSGNCVQAGTGGMLTTTGSACGSGGSGIADPFSHPFLGWSATTSSMVFGTSTPTLAGQLTVGSSTVPQLALVDNGNTTAWTLRNFGGALFLATSSPTTFATSTVAAFTIIGATTTNAYSFSANNSQFVTDYYTGTTTIAQLYTGGLNFETDAGTLAALTLPVANSTANTLEAMNFMLGTSTGASLAGWIGGTGTINPNQITFAIATTTSQPGQAYPAGQLEIGTNGAGGTTTISMGKIQYQGYNAAGSIVCTYIVGTSWVISTGNCVQ